MFALWDWQRVVVVVVVRWWFEKRERGRGREKTDRLDQLGGLDCAVRLRKSRALFA